MRYDCRSIGRVWDGNYCEMLMAVVCYGIPFDSCLLREQIFVSHNIFLKQTVVLSLSVSPMNLYSCRNKNRILRLLVNATIGFGFGSLPLDRVENNIFSVGANGFTNFVISTKILLNRKRNVLQNAVGL